MPFFVIILCTLTIFINIILISQLSQEIHNTTNPLKQGNNTQSFDMTEYENLNSSYITIIMPYDEFNGYNGVNATI